MLSSHLLSEANRLLEEVEQKGTHFQELDSWEQAYNNYKVLVQNSPNDIPSSIISNLPYVGMGIQIAKKTGRPESCAFFLKNAKRKFVKGLRTMVAISSQAEQAA